MSDLLIRLSKAINLIVSQSTLYKWSASKRFHPDIFVRIGGRVYVNVDKLNRIAKGEEQS